MLMKHMNVPMDTSNDNAFKIVLEKYEVEHEKRIKAEKDLEKLQIKDNATQCEVDIEPPKVVIESMPLIVKENEKMINIKQLALQQAIKMKHIDIVKEIVNNDNMSINKAFQWAIYVNKLVVAVEFMKAGAAVQSDDFYAFKLACRAGFLTAIRYLTETYRAKFNYIWGYFNIGLSIASCEGHLDIVEYFIEKYDLNIYKTNALTEAISHGHFDIVMKLLPLRKESDYSNIPNDYMFLRIACENGHVKLAQYFMEQLNVKYNDALQWGAACGQLNIVKWALDIEMHNISDYSQDEYNEAIKTAANNGHLDIVEYIIENKQLKKA